MSNDFESEQPEMVTCEVTQEQVPFDETVVIQGVRVSARGKQLLMEQLETGHAADGELEAPGSWRRLGCAILDGLIMGVIAAVLGAVSVAMMTGSQSDGRIEGAFELISVIIAMAYFTFMHASNGQTLGKMAGKFKVVNLDGSDIDFKAALIRGFMFTGIQAIAPIVILVGGYELIGLYGALSGAIAVYGLANAITVLATKDKRAIHDLVAGTRAVMIQN